MARTRVTPEKRDQWLADVKANAFRFEGKTISDATGYSPGHISQFLNKEALPTEVFMEIYYKKFPKRAEKVSKNIHEAVNETWKQTEQNKEQTKTGFDQVLESLASSYEQLSAAHNRLTITHDKIVDILGATANGQQEKSADPTLATWVETTVQNGLKSGLWRNRQEAESNIYKIIEMNLSKNR